MSAEAEWLNSRDNFDVSRRNTGNVISTAWSFELGTGLAEVKLAARAMLRINSLSPGSSSRISQSVYVVVSLLEMSSEVPSLETTSVTIWPIILSPSGLC